MSMSPFAARYAMESALAIALLYLWMKFWQSIYATRLKCFAANEPPPRFTTSTILRRFEQQAILQPYSVFVLPLSFLAFLPFGWVFAFYHNLSLTANGEKSDAKEARRKAWQLASVWPGQNHRIIAIFFLFIFVVFLNLRAFLLMVPYLLRMLFGIETTITLSGEHIFNTTFLAVVAGMVISA